MLRRRLIEMAGDLYDIASMGSTSMTGLGLCGYALALGFPHNPLVKPSLVIFI